MEARERTGVYEGSERRHEMRSARMYCRNCLRLNETHLWREVRLKRAECPDMNCIFRYDVLHNLYLAISVALKACLMRYMQSDIPQSYPNGAASLQKPV